MWRVFRLVLGGVIAIALFTAAQIAQATVMTIEIEAMIDGRDLLIIDGNTLQWDHRSFAAVGRHAGLDQPTIITTTLNGVTMLDHVEWLPQWSAPAPDEIRSPELSSLFIGLVPGLPGAPISVQLDILSARDSLALVTSLIAGVDPIIVDFDDRTPHGHATYAARLTLEFANRLALPEPMTAGLLALGIGSIAVSRWKRKATGL